MQKFLFTDGTNGVIETFSLEELKTQIDNSSQKQKIRIWKFNSSEWMSYESFQKIFSLQQPQLQVMPVEPGRNGNRWLKKFLFVGMLAALTILIVNFTSVKWEKAADLETIAPRPQNVPFVDVDSLIGTIEWYRGRFLDKSTRTNLRTRNTWPDLIDLRLHSQKETSSTGTRFSNPTISIDNNTGFPIDKAIVTLFSWKNGESSEIDTLSFQQLSFEESNKRTLDRTIRADSISVSFSVIKAKSFNFSYSSKAKLKEGAYDPWFVMDKK
jgi:hypothetical protein